MSGLFENLAATDDSALIAHRQATAVANKRVKDRFGSFLANAHRDRPARLALVEDDITAIVTDVVAEYGGDARKIEAAIKHSLGMADPTNPGLLGGQSAPMGAAGQGQAQQPAAQPAAGPTGATCPQCGGQMVNGQCPACQGAGAAAGPGGAYGMQHTLPQSPSTGPIQAAVIAAGGYCDECKGWKHKGDCHCEAETVDHEEGTDGNDGDDGGTTSSFRLARRPKMCPYHSEVVDISLGSGDPQSGFNAMANHAWGEQHCKGGFEGSCNFRPSMVTQKYWDDKQLEADERREQRELDRQPPAASDLSIDTEPIMHAEPLPDEPGKEGVTDIDGELADAPSAVGAGEMAIASTRRKEAEALKTVDLPTGNDTGLGGPSPKIDKGKSGDQGGWSLEPIDTQMDGSPHPSIEQDPTDKADYNKDDFLDQTKAVNKSETLPTETGDAGYNTLRNIKQYPGTTFPKGDQANPVTRESVLHRTANQWIQQRGDKYVIIQKGTGKTLSTHDSQAQAQASFDAMEAHKHGAAPHGYPQHGERHEVDFAHPDYDPDSYHICQGCGGDYLDPDGETPCPNCGRVDAATNDLNAPGGVAEQLGQGLMPGHRGAVDPDKNPIRTILEEYSGFLMPNEVTAAVRDWEVG